METQFLTPKELAARWKLSYKIVSEWRCNGYGPKFTKLGNRVRYQIVDVEKFEESKQQYNTSTPTSSSHLSPTSPFLTNHMKQQKKFNSRGGN